MNKTITLLKRIKTPVWVGIIVLMVAVVVIISSSQVLYNRTVDLLTQNLRDRILTISITTASSIDSNDLEALQVQNDWKKPQWANIVNKLNKAKYANEDVVFMYIFRKTQNDPTKMEFVADADSIDPFANTSNDSSRYVDVNRDGKIEPDGPDKLQWPGQPYPEAVDIPEAFDAYTKAVTSKDIYTDDYGSVITGYAPIKDTNGNTVAVLASDVKANDFFTITTQTLRPFLIFIVFLTVIISILTIVLIYSWRKYSRFLEKSNAQKSEFVSFATHQLKSPLAAMKGYASLILDGDYGEISKEVRESVSRIFESAKTLAVVVEDYLDVSRIELGSMKYYFSDQDLKKLVDDVIEEIEPNIKKSGIQFSFSPGTDDYTASVDPDKIKQVFMNLIDNAVKYTPTGKVEVFLKKIDQKILLSIIDTGIGMKPGTIESLFAKFTRAYNANKTNIHGTGLGLYVARQIAEAHHGRVWAESEGEGKGSQFYVELPVKNK